MIFLQLIYSYLKKDSFWGSPWKKKKPHFLFLLLQPICAAKVSIFFNCINGSSKEFGKGFGQGFGKGKNDVVIDCFLYLPWENFFVCLFFYRVLVSISKLEDSTSLNLHNVKSIQKIIFIIRIFLYSRFEFDSIYFIYCIISFDFFSFSIYVILLDLVQSLRKKIITYDYLS